MNTANSTVLTRSDLLRRGITLEAVVITWNVVEGIIAIFAGVLAHSVALIGFGVDSAIEVTSAVVVFWRLRAELHDDNWSEDREETASRIAGALLILLAVYLVIDAGRRLLGFGAAPETSIIGIVLTTLSLVVMPLLAWAKLRTADQLGSGALRADAMETLTCGWLSLALVIGLLLNAIWGWHWADPLAALVIVPLLLREGREAWSGHGCCHDHASGADQHHDTPDSDSASNETLTSH